MANSFEDLVIWQRAIDIAKDVYILIQHESITKDRWIKDQLRRSAVSISSNIAEWFER